MIWTPSKLIPNLQLGDLNGPWHFKQAAQMAPSPSTHGRMRYIVSLTQTQTTSKHRTQVLVKTQRNCILPTLLLGLKQAVMENNLAVPQVKPRAHTTPQFHSSKRRESTTTHKPVQDYRRSSEGRKPMSIS